jgi:hypothetical protein
MAGFKVITEDTFLGAFDTLDNAYKEGVEKFGRDAFLVRRIAEHDEVYRNQAFSLGLINARI